MQVEVETFDYDPATASATLVETRQLRNGDRIPSSWFPCDYLPSQTPLPFNRLGLYTNIPDAFGPPTLLQDIARPGRLPQEFRTLMPQHAILVEIIVGQFNFDPPWTRRRQTSLEGVDFAAEKLGTNPRQNSIGILADVVIPLVELDALIRARNETYIPLADAQAPETRFRRMRIVP